MTRVVIESPLNAPTRAGIEENKHYAKRCILDSLHRGEAPYASHIFFDQPGLLDDLRPAERETGLLAGFAWGEAAEVVAVYVDKGISMGMARGIDRAHRRGQPVLYRSLFGDHRDLTSREVAKCLEATSPEIRNVIFKHLSDGREAVPRVRHDGSTR